MMSLAKAGKISMSGFMRPVLGVSLLALTLSGCDMELLGQDKAYNFDFLLIDTAVMPGVTDFC